MTTSTSQPHSPIDQVPEPSRPCFGIANNLDQVIDAWRLVYHSYRRIGLIDPNPSQVHCSPQAVHPDSVVISGHVRGRGVVSTLTMIHDGPGGLPLDGVYRTELDALRRGGRRLMEVGLLADQREQISRTLSSIFEMMRYVFWRCHYTRSDIVIGVHPHHAGFYANCFGFEVIGPETVHPSVKNHPVVLLRVDYGVTLPLNPKPSRLRQHKENPLPPEVFEDRFNFAPGAVAGSAIEQFLATKYRPAGAA